MIGIVLLEKNVDMLLLLVLMLKLMMLLMVFEVIVDGWLLVIEELLVLQYVMNYGGFSMFLCVGEWVLVEDLLCGVIVLLGNDVSVVLVEVLFFDGIEVGFVCMMIECVWQLGMMNLIFVNLNGWLVVGYCMLMCDLGILVDCLISEFLIFYLLFVEQEFLFDGCVFVNSQNCNLILGLGIGVDGLKIGYMFEVGYGLVGLVKQGDCCVIFVIIGLDSSQVCVEEVECIVNWVFCNFVCKDVVEVGICIVEVEVWCGDVVIVGLIVVEDFDLLVLVLV